MGTFEISAIERNEIVRLMVGRELKEMFPKTKVDIGELLLKVSNLSYRNMIKDVSFELYASEILGITGLMGSKRTELVKAAFGCYGPTPGKVEVSGRLLNRSHPSMAMKEGLGYITEDRKNEGTSSCRCPSPTTFRYPASAGFLSWAEAEEARESLT